MVFRVPPPEGGAGGWFWECSGFRAEVPPRRAECPKRPGASVRRLAARATSQGGQRRARESGTKRATGERLAEAFRRAPLRSATGGQRTSNPVRAGHRQTTGLGDDGRRNHNGEQISGCMPKLTPAQHRATRKR